jgi:hypothetical protein
MAHLHPSSANNFPPIKMVFLPVILPFSLTKNLPATRSETEGLAKEISALLVMPFKSSWK